ncbi:MAG: arsenate reductase (glutaredoxin) [Saprospiraceae bacterium]
MNLQVFHNPRCSKSRAALKYLDEKGIKYDTILYLKDNPDFKQLKEIIDKLNIKPLDLIRKKEKIFTTTYKGQNLTDDEWIQVMVDNPVLIERPVVFNEAKAVVGRPVELIDELL